MSGKRMGRPPLETPKSKRIDVRITEEEYQMLTAYCEKVGVSHPQALRNFIKELYEQEFGGQK